MHYSFKSTPTWTMKGRPQSIYHLTQHLNPKIQGLLTTLYENLSTTPAMFLQSLSKEICINNFNPTQDQGLTILNHLPRKAKRDP